jgi:hypothetical protein
MMQRLMAASIAMAVGMFGVAPVTFAADGPMREINLTADSAPGWRPSPALEQNAKSAALAYLGNIDTGRYADAYEALDQLNRQESLDAFSARLQKFNALAGSVKNRQIIKITWTKDPAQSPAPGIYVAIDLTSHFSNIDRHCGYIVLYQKPVGGEFSVMRSEDNFLDNATAKAIASKQSASGVDQVWAQVSANCPNYRRDDVAREPLPETQEASIGYPTVAAALSDLRSKRGVVITTQNGWIIANDSAATTIWSFAPTGNPAYPSAVKRQIEDRDGSAYVKMSVHCEASKSACDDLVRSFQALNAQMAQSLKGR